MLVFDSDEMYLGPVAVVTYIHQKEQSLPRLRALAVLIHAGICGCQQKINNAVVKRCGIF